MLFLGRLGNSKINLMGASTASIELMLGSPTTLELKERRLDFQELIHQFKVLRAKTAYLDPGEFLFIFKTFTTVFVRSLTDSIGRGVTPEMLIQYPTGFL